MHLAIHVHRPSLRRALAMTASAAALTVSAASAQDHRVVTIIVPYPAGGIGDILPRAMADVLAQQTGQSFVIDNKPGATQMIGARLAANAKPDGTTIFAAA
jgi:tripartite-type tricarboxylate transporter receptor subunit TctC